MHHRRDRQRQIHGIGAACFEDVFGAANGAAIERRAEAVARHGKKVFDARADEVTAVEAEERGGGVIGKSNTAVAIADEQHIGHRVDDFLRGERWRDRDEIVAANSVRDDDDKSENR